MAEGIEEKLKRRTKQFALRVVRLVEQLEKAGGIPRRAIAGQLMRSACSVGANYRAACRARSAAEFVAKLGVVEEEADESCFWMEMLGEAELMNARRLAGLLQEGSEIVALIAASRQTCLRNRRAKA